jgi:dolichol-phosphate mannosyltransferase
MSEPSKLSIVVPFRDEEPNVGPVLAEIRRCQPGAEIIAVDDGSSDGTATALADHPGVIVLRLAQPMGQSAALYAGLRRASGDVLAILDGDGQSNVGDIKPLLEQLSESDLVIGRRVVRQDDAARRAASWIANGLRRLILKDGVHDTGGTPKVMKRACLEAIVPFDGFHRFLPALVSAAGLRVREVPVAHNERLHGRSKYSNVTRGLRGIVDLAGAAWLRGRRIDLPLLARAEELSPPEAGDAVADLSANGSE